MRDFNANEWEIYYKFPSGNCFLIYAIINKSLSSTTAST